MRITDPDAPPLPGDSRAPARLGREGMSAKGKEHRAALKAAGFEHTGKADHWGDEYDKFTNADGERLASALWRDGDAAAHPQISASVK
jgi:hypothetical protein